jgi:hypothetical protein
MTTKRSLYQIVNQQFDKAAALMDLDPNIHGILSRPTNEIEVHFPVKLASGKIEMFTGYRVQHNNARPISMSLPANRLDREAASAGTRRRVRASCT